MSVLGTADAATAPLVTSTGVHLKGTSALRVLCPACGLVDTVFDPRDALRRLFRQGDGESANAPARRRSDVIVKGGAALHRRHVVEAFLFDQCRERFGTQPQGAMLEIGCGEGHLTRRFAHRFQTWRVIGVDPSPMLSDDWPPASGRPGFIRDFFDPQLFSGQRFDVVIAHEVLNCTDLMASLAAVRGICSDNALVSFEVVTLEHAVEAPRIWDLATLFTQTRLRAALEEAGFDVLHMEDCVSTCHVLAQAGTPRREAPDLSGEAEQAGAFYRGHELWWRRVAIRAERALALAHAQGQAVALYGAGMFSAALAGLVPGLDPAVIIDDVAPGGRFMDRPVLSRADAAGRPLIVLLCTRPAYRKHMAANLRKSGLVFVDLVGDEALTPAFTQTGASG